MAQAVRTLKELQEIVEKTQKTLIRERIPSSSYDNGVPRSALIEITGTAKVEWLIRLFNENPNLQILWFEENFTLLPTSLYQMGVNPNRIIYVECKTDLFKHLRKALKFQVFDCIVAPSIFTDERTLKVLQLLSEKSNSATILLAHEPKKAWAISLQLQIDRTVSYSDRSHFDVKTIKEKSLFKNVSSL